MNPATIRPADPDRDAAACVAIYAPHVEAGATSFEEVPPTPEELGRRIATTTEVHPWLVAESDGSVLGYAYAGPHRARPAYRWAVEVSVYIASGRRREGHATALYQELSECLRRQRFQVVCAGITLPNEASIALHESLGFVEVGVYRRIGWKDGAWRDVAWWQLELQPPGEGKPDEPLPPER